MPVNMPHAIWHLKYNFLNIMYEYTEVKFLHQPRDTHCYSKHIIWHLMLNCYLTTQETWDAKKQSKTEMTGYEKATFNKILSVFKLRQK